MNAQQLAAFALTNGAELSIDGRVINPGRERFSLVRARPEQPPPAAAQEPAPQNQGRPPGMTAEQVQAMLDARDARLDEQMKQIIMMVAQLAPARRSDPSFVPVYDEQSGALLRVDVIRP